MCVSICSDHQVDTNKQRWVVQVLDDKKADQKQGIS